MKKSDDQIKVEQYIEEIVKQANDAYEKLKETGDWEAFGRRIEGIYRSYYMVNDLYSQAMLQVASGSVKGLNPEIVGGNYGFRVQALKQTEVQQSLDIAREIAKKYGKTQASYYVKGLPVCLRWACNEIEESKKQVNKFFKDVITVAKA